MNGKHCNPNQTPRSAASDLCLHFAQDCLFEYLSKLINTVYVRVAGHCTMAWRALIKLLVTNQVLAVLTSKDSSL